MDNNITSVGFTPAPYKSPQGQSRDTAASQRPGQPQDVLDVGRKTLTIEDVQRILRERISEKIRSAMEEVWQSRDLRPDAAPDDSSAEATAGRIADFAEMGFELWRKNHQDLDEDTARKTYSEFIGKAVNQGIKEARQIFEALGALHGKTAEFVDTIEKLVNERIEAFGKPREKEAV